VIARPFSGDFEEILKVQVFDKDKFSKDGATSFVRELEK
jgi:hypothetical protein